MQRLSQYRKRLQGYKTNKNVDESLMTIFLLEVVAHRAGVKKVRWESFRVEA